MGASDQTAASTATGATEVASPPLRGMVAVMATPTNAATAPITKQSRKAPWVGIAKPPRLWVELVRTVPMSAAARVVPTERIRARVWGIVPQVSAPTPNDYPYGPFGVKQRDRYVDSSDQAIGELF